MGNCAKDVDEQKAKQLAKQKKKNSPNKNSDSQEDVPTINVKKVDDVKNKNIDNPQATGQNLNITQQKQKPNKVPSSLQVDQSDDFDIPNKLNMQSNIVKKNRAA